MALVLLVVALTSALIAMRLAVHGSEVTVPDLRGKTPAEARRIAEDNGLAAQVESNYYSPTIPQGKILSQMPAPGTLVRRGWEVRLALSLGPQRVAIPQVVGSSQRAAGINIAKRGLELSSTASIKLPGTDAGLVLAQDPAANASDIAAPKISLLVSDESPPQAFAMPSFIGQPLGGATVILHSAGFSLGKVATEPSPPPPSVAEGTTSTPETTPTPAASPASPSPAGPSPASIIVSQDPIPGTKVLAGSTINFVVR